MYIHIQYISIFDFVLTLLHKVLLFHMILGCHSLHKQTDFTVRLTNRHDNPQSRAPTCWSEPAQRLLIFHQGLFRVALHTSPRLERRDPVKHESQN